MVDIETLGTSAGSAILSVGAVEFGVSGPGPSFYRGVDLDSALAVGQVVDGSTVKWWLRQSAEAREAVSGEGSHLSEVLLMLQGFVGDRPVWGNGAAFDNAILREAFRLCGLMPWSHRQDRCYRTLAALAPQVSAPEREGTYHNARQDARHQARHAAAIFRALGLA